MNKNIFIMIILVFLMTLIGCSKNDANNNNNESGENFPPNFSSVFIVNGTEYDMENGWFRWKRKTGDSIEVTQTDAMSPDQIAEDLEGVSIKPEEMITIAVEEDPDLEAYLWDQDERVGEIEIRDSQIIALLDKGRYIYEIIATWSNGERSYTFVVEVE